MRLISFAPQYYKNSKLQTNKKFRYFTFECFSNDGETLLAMRKKLEKMKEDFCSPAVTKKIGHYRWNRQTFAILCIVRDILQRLELETEE